MARATPASHGALAAKSCRQRVFVRSKALTPITMLVIIVIVFYVSIIIVILIDFAVLAIVIVIITITVIVGGQRTEDDSGDENDADGDFELAMMFCTCPTRAPCIPEVSRLSVLWFSYACPTVDV